MRDKKERKVIKAKREHLPNTVSYRRVINLPYIFFCCCLCLIQMQYEYEPIKFVFDKTIMHFLNKTICKIYLGTFFETKSISKGFMRKIY